MDNTIESMLGTRRWVPQILGSWEKDAVEVTTAPKHQLPSEISEKIPLSWEIVMRNVAQEIGVEGEDWRIVEADPYAKLEVKREFDWGLRMFAGDQTRIEDYSLDGQTLKLVHSPANYAESLATNNTDPWGLIMQYGERTALADGHAVSVAVTGLTENGREAMQFFRRGEGLGEYGGYIGTAAGNSMKPEMVPFDIASRKLIEESRVMPFIAAYKSILYESGIVAPNLDLDEYKRIGLATSDFETVEKVSGGRKVRFLDRKENKAYGLLVSEDTKLILTGLALNVDSEDYDTQGNNKPHHKSEYLFLLKTKLPLEALNDPQFGWVRNDEHADVLYVPFNLDNLTEFAVENFKGMMPPTSAVTLTAIRGAFGHDQYLKALNAINSRYPTTEEHPLLKVIETGKYTQPKLLIQ